MKRIILIIALIVSTTASSAWAQKTTHPGIELYLSGKNVEAVDSLLQAVKQKEFEKHAEIWNYLGLAYIHTKDFKNAKKALETAVKLGPESSACHANLGHAYLMLGEMGKALSEVTRAIQLDPRNTTAYYVRGVVNFYYRQLDPAEGYADEIIRNDPTFPQAYVLKSNVLLAKFGLLVQGGSTPKAEIRYLEEATATLHYGVENCINSLDRKIVEDELETVATFYNHFLTVESSPKTDTKDPSITPLYIHSKARPEYSDAARSRGVQGTVSVAVLFGASGKIERVLLVRPLGFGLDEKAIKAAQKIRFEPKKKDGKPVSTVRIVEYTFSLY